MTAQLNDDLQREVDAHAGQPVEVEHPLTHKRYVIVESDTYRRNMQALRKQEDLEAIQKGIDAMEEGRTISLAEADRQIREELGFSPRTQ